MQALRDNSLKSRAYLQYRRVSDEEAVLQHKRKQRKVSASLEYVVKNEGIDTHNVHYQHLLKQHHKLRQHVRHCSNTGCDSKCVPFSIKCSRRILISAPHVAIEWAECVDETILFPCVFERLK